MEGTTDLQGFNLLAELMVLHRQILFSLVIAAIAEAILIWTSDGQVPSLHRVAPRYMLAHFKTLYMSHNLALAPAPSSAFQTSLSTCLIT